MLAVCRPSAFEDRDGFTAVHWAAMEDEALTMPGTWLFESNRIDAGETPDSRSEEVFARPWVRCKRKRLQGGHLLSDSCSSLLSLAITALEGLDTSDACLCPRSRREAGTLVERCHGLRILTWKILQQ